MSLMKILYNWDRILAFSSERETLAHSTQPTVQPQVQLYFNDIERNVIDKWFLRAWEKHCLKRFLSKFTVHVTKKILKLILKLELTDAAKQVVWAKCENWKIYRKNLFNSTVRLHFKVTHDCFKWQWGQNFTVGEEMTWERSQRGNQCKDRECFFEKNWSFKNHPASNAQQPSSRQRTVLYCKH